MQCHHIRKQLLLYLDDELPTPDRQEIERHLSTCAHCAEHLNELRKIWCNAARVETIEPSPGLWTRLLSRLSEAKAAGWSFAGVRGWVADHAVPLVATVLFAIGMLIGVYLGMPPQTRIADKPVASTSADARADFIKTTYLDAFDDLPASTLGGAFLALEINQP